MTTETESAAVTKRLEKLERQIRWMRRGWATVVVLAAAMVLMGGQSQSKDSHPDNFVVRDDKGNERAWLGMGEDGPVLRFRGAEGKERLWLGVAKSTPGLVFYDEEGNRRAALSAGKSAAKLVFYDGKNTPKAWLVIGDEAAALHLRGSQGASHAGLSVEEDGIAVWRHDPAGNVRVMENALKNIPGKSLHGEIADPLHPGRD
jgi:hypothetical protein